MHSYSSPGEPEERVRVRNKGCAGAGRVLNHLKATFDVRALSHLLAFVPQFLPYLASRGGGSGQIGPYIHTYPGKIQNFCLLILDFGMINVILSRN